MAEKLVAYSAGSEPSFPSNYEVPIRRTLNFTDIVNNSNKYYNLEVQVGPNGEARIYTTYGRTGGTAAKEYRVCRDKNHAESESDKIIKAKTKKGYAEVKLIKADVGSEVGKAKVEVSKVSIDELQKVGVKLDDSLVVKSKLHPEVNDLVRTWFGVTADFLELNLDTKKCPLGQLSLDQISKAKDFLEEARKQVHSKKPDTLELNKLTNLYYSNIPHNFGYARISADTLRFDNDVKINAAFDILDVFTDAKNVQSVLSKKNNVDSQYDTLNADLEFVDSDSPTWKWINRMLLETRAANHNFLGKLKTHKIFKLTRKNEDKMFLETAEKIAKECGKHSPSSVYSSLVKDRPDLSKEERELYSRANVSPGWHGTRRANMIGITTKGLLIRPSGVVHAGSAYGDGIYWATNSTKSINYCDVKGSYWAQGNNKTAYLFLGDVAYGNCKLVSTSGFYSKSNIAPNHSVWAQAGRGGVINDELITYTPTGPGQQHMIKYIIEFETMVK
jgi:poly [ADP-ribose] polymerase 2/3/4